MIERKPICCPQKVNLNEEDLCVVADDCYFLYLLASKQL